MKIEVNLNSTVLKKSFWRNEVFFYISGNKPFNTKVTECEKRRENVTYTTGTNTSLLSD